MASQDVDVNAGDCTADVPGETARTPGDYEGGLDDPGVFNWENAPLSPNRDGCFPDENGTANVRATCGQADVGVLGTGTGPVRPARLDLALSPGPPARHA